MACAQCSAHAQAPCSVCDRLFCDACRSSHQSRHYLTQQLVTIFYEPLSTSQLDSCGAITPVAIAALLSTAVHGPLLVCVLLDAPTSVITYPLLQRLLAFHHEPLSTLCVQFLTSKMTDTPPNAVAVEFLLLSPVLLSQSFATTRYAICQLFSKCPVLLLSLLTHAAAPASPWVHWLCLASAPELFTPTQLTETCSSLFPQSVSMLVADYVFFGGKDLALEAMDVWEDFIEQDLGSQNPLVTPIAEALLFGMVWRTDETVDEDKAPDDEELLLPPRSKHAKVDEPPHSSTSSPSSSLGAASSLSSSSPFAPSRSPFSFPLSSPASPVSPPEGGWETIHQASSALRKSAARNFDRLSLHHLPAALCVITPRLTAFLNAGKFRRCDLSESEMLEAETCVLALGALRSCDDEMLGDAFRGMLGLTEWLKSDYALLASTVAWVLSRYAASDGELGVTLFSPLVDVLLTNQQPYVQQAVLSALTIVLDAMSPTQVCEVIAPHWQSILRLLPLMKTRVSQLLYFEIWGSVTDRGEEEFGAKYGRDLVWFLWQAWDEPLNFKDVCISLCDSLQLSVKHAQLSAEEIEALWRRAREWIMVETLPSVMAAVLELACAVVEKAWEKGLYDVIIDNLEPDTFFVYLMSLAATMRDGVQGAALSVVGTLALDDRPGMADLFAQADYKSVLSSHLSVPNAIWTAGNVVELCKPGLDVCTTLAANLYHLRDANNYHHNVRFALAQIAGVSPVAVEPYADIFSWICLEVGRYSPEVRITVMLVKAIVAISTYKTWHGYAKIYQATFDPNGPPQVYSTQVLVFRVLQQLLTRAPERCRRGAWLESLRSWRYHAGGSWPVALIRVPGEVFTFDTLCQFWGIRDVLTLEDAKTETLA